VLIMYSKSCLCFFGVKSASTEFCCIFPPKV
jgi:hypothetical protein